MNHLGGPFDYMLDGHITDRGCPLTTCTPVCADFEDPGTIIRTASRNSWKSVTVVTVARTSAADNSDAGIALEICHLANIVLNAVQVSLLHL